MGRFDRELEGRLGAVVASYGSVGCLMAEQAVNLLSCKQGRKRIPLLAGDKATESHADVARYRPGVIISGATSSIAARLGNGGVPPIISDENSAK